MPPDQERPPANAASPPAAAGVMDLPSAPLAVTLNERPLRGARVSAVLYIGPQQTGELMEVNARDHWMRLRAADGGTVWLPFQQVKRLLFTQPLEPAPEDGMPGSSGGLSQVRGEPREVEIHYRDGSHSAFKVQHFFEDAAGVHLFQRGAGGVLVRMFVPQGSYTRMEAWEPIGEALAQRGLASPEAVGDGLKLQRELRERRIGEYLQKRAVLTPRQLEEAVQQQRLKPELKLGEILVDEALISPAELAQVLEEQHRDRRRHLGDILVDKGLVDPGELVLVLSERLGIPHVPLPEFPVDPGVLSFVPREVALRWECLPLMLARERLLVAAADPLNPELRDTLQLLSGRQIEPVLATRQGILAAIELHYPPPRSDDLTWDAPPPVMAAPAAETPVAVASSASAPAVAPAAAAPPPAPPEDWQLLDSGQAPALPAGEGESVDFASLTPSVPAPAAPALSLADSLPAAAPAAAPAATAAGPQMLRSLLEEALQRNATGLRVHAAASGLAVACRLDGAWAPARTLGRELQPLLLAQVRELAGLRGAGLEAPQEGSGQMNFEGRTVELHLSLLPIVGGYSVVIQFQREQPSLAGLHDLGLDAADEARLNAALEIEEGLLLVAGPAASGKTTTLQALTAALVRRQLSVFSVLAGATRPLEGVDQVPVAAGGSVATAVERILAHGADAVLVEDLWDRDTARALVHGAVSGHRGLASLRAASVIEALTRLADFGVDAVQLAAATRAVIAQRLLRRNCPHCIAKERPQGVVLRALGLDPDAGLLFRGQGCSRCAGTGFAGRALVYEALFPDEPLRRLLIRGASRAQLEEQALRGGLSGMLERILALVRDGTVSPDEAYHAWQSLPHDG